MKKRIGRPSPALAISLLALFVALGGTGLAAGALINGKNIKNKTIAGKKLKNKTISGGKVKGNTLTGTQINESTLGKVPSAAAADTAANAANAANATNAANADKLDGKDGSDFGPIAFASIDGTAATVDAGSGKNLSNANVTHSTILGLEVGVYCFGGINPAPRNIIAQHSDDTFLLNIASEIGDSAALLCPAGYRQARVVTYDDDSLENADFSVLFN